MKEILFYNGDILTMEEELYKEAVLVREDKIIKLGTKEELLAIASEKVEVRDLQGKTLMPAFIDSHSHFLGYANSLLQVSLEHVSNYREMIHAIKVFITKNQIPAGQWVVATGYDHNYLMEKKNPTKEVLDEASKVHPIAIMHQSGHSGVFNTLGLEELGITGETQNPEGGVIEKKDGEATGFLEENAFVDSIKRVPMPSMEELMAAVIKAQENYASYGITTMQEGMVVRKLADLLKYIQTSNLLKIDYVGYVDIKEAEIVLPMFEDSINQYKNHFKIGGYKIFLDGSPQSKTAYMLQPYEGEDEGNCGYPIYQDEELEEKFEIALQEDRQIIVHCNGDAATKQYITQYAIACERVKHNKDIRPVMIHAQLLPPKQLDEVKRLKMIPSFFVAHVYYWGDIHIKNFGKDRADHISCANSAKEKGILFTFHQDAPVIEPNMLETVWCAVNRITKDGVLLGNEERVEPFDALKALTLNGAYQYFEEDKKGSIKEGKLADLIVLDKNPLKVDPMELKSIKVLETIKCGETIFRV